MPVTHTPPKTSGKAVEENAAMTATIVNPEHVDHSKTPSPTPTEESLEEIRERTRMMEESLKKNTEYEDHHEKTQTTESLVKEVKQLVEDHDGENNACRDRQHEFERRTKSRLAPVAKKFINAVNTILFQLNREKFADEISQPYGDELLSDVHTLYIKVQEAREYCEEVLNEEELLSLGDYLQSKFEMVLTCERVHRKYFEEQEENKRLRKQYEEEQIHPEAPIVTKANVQSKPIVTSTPYHQHSQYQFKPLGLDQNHHGQKDPNYGQRTYPGFKNYEDQDHHGRQDQQQGQSQQRPPGFKSYEEQDHHGQKNQQHGQSQQKPKEAGFNVYEEEDHHGHQGGRGQSKQMPNSGFNVYNDQDHGSRIPTPSVVETHHHTRFKLNEELSLVEKWDGSQPRAYMAFRAQWNNFYQKMVVAQRSNLDIFYALLKVVEGSPKDLIKTKYPNDMSYHNAIKRLDDLFYNPTNLLRDMVQNLLKGQKMVDTYDSLLSGITKLMDAWNDLNQADLSKDQLKGLLFIAATEKNLSEESWNQWLLVQNDPKYRQNPMSAFEIQAFLGSINMAMLNAQRRRNALGSSSHTKPQTNTGGSSRRQSTLYGSYALGHHGQEKGQSKVKDQQQARGQNNSCIICSQNPHRYQLNCPKLRELSPNQIYKIMTSSGIECQMCLGLGHRTRECPPTQEGFLKKCSIKEENMECGKYHCRALHKPKKQEEQWGRRNEESKETSQSKPKQE